MSCDKNFVKTGDQIRVNVKVDNSEGKKEI
jgi:hypothetical protein